MEQHGGFWIRAVAYFIDCLIAGIILVPAGLIVGGENEIPAAISLSITLIYYLGSLLMFSSTPGKLMFGMKIINAQTGENIGVLAIILRFLGQGISSIFLCIGYFWIGFDARKRGWHDYIAGTEVIYYR